VGGGGGGGVTIPPSYKEEAGFHQEAGALKEDER